MRKYMLDTNICIFLLKRKYPSVIHKFLSHEPEEMCISSITYSELMYGVESSQSREKTLLALMNFLARIDILPLDKRAAEESGRIRAELRKKGTPIGPLDTLIAGHAFAENLTVITNNTREFSRVENLCVEDWVQLS